MRTDRSIEAGNIAQIVGLFWFFKGTRRNSPIVHTGHIALIPDGDRVPILDPALGPIEVEAYLIETQTMKGASGSPVFVRKPLAAKAADHGDPPSVAPKAYGAVFLLGMYQGSWDGSAGALIEEDRQRRDLRVPVGMGLAVPGDKIIEAINQHVQVELDESH